MSEEVRGIQDLLASLTPSSVRSVKLETPTRGEESRTSNNANQHNDSSGLSAPAPKRTRSDHSDQSASLLNLLRFNSASSSQASPLPTLSSPTAIGQQSKDQNIHGRGVSSSDLVASFMGKPTISQAAGTAHPASIPDVHGSSANPQDYLLQLLNRNSNSQNRVASHKSISTTSLDSKSPKVEANSDSDRTASIRKQSGNDDSVRQASPIRVFGSQASRETTPFEPDMSTKVASPSKPETAAIFSYVNPFEHLAANSPLKGRSGTTTPVKEVQNKLQSDHSRNTTPVSAMKSPLSANGHGILQSIEGPDGKTSSARDRLADLGAPTNDKATVAQALNEVGAQVNRQVEYALAQQQVEDEEEADEPAEDTIQNQLQRAAASGAKKELNSAKKEISTADTPKAQAVSTKEAIDEVATENVDGHHESADDEGSSGKAEADIDVPVYGLPMRPFVSIDIQSGKDCDLAFRDSSITDIVRLKKEFDQVDRVLAVASNNYIVYALPKPGGFRAIRQEDGVDRQAFKETKDHVFNVAISNEAHNRKNKSGLESCIATAVSGSVYWAALRKHGEDLISGSEFEHNTLVFPPVPAHDDNTSGGQLKTRAKKSSRHPDYFAVGRGKTIQLVFPLRAQSSNHVSEKNIVDTEKYFKESGLKINMGKAGKDFAFSEDDTVIATLDKSGRLRLWDITDLVDDADPRSKASDTELKTPVLSFSTASGSSKSWPTSVLFVDKPRAYIKGCAQRYVIVGMKQNHTLQLWDLGLGKAVQEINFPHEKESDAICSISYHHHSGIVVVGHPTRNSIYFIHLSAPKYNLLGLTEAKYISRLANSDSTLPRPDSTAILSGIREYSFASKGQLRSLEILPATADGSIDQVRGLFEVYVMHSKGVTCLSIGKADLGWTEDNQVILPKDAETEAYVIVKELRELTGTQVSEPSSVNGEPAPPAPIRSQSKLKKSSEASSKLETQLSSLSVNERNILEIPQDKPERRPKKKRTATHSTEDAFIPPPAPVAPMDKINVAASTSKDVSQNEKVNESLAKTSEQPKSSSQEQSNNFDEQQFLSAIKTELEAFKGQVNDSYKTLEESSRAKQAEVLHLVSEQLGNNVEKALARIVMANFTQTVIPSIHNVTATTLRNELPEWLSKNLLQTLPAQLKLSLPEAVSKAISNPEILKFMSDQITAKISSHVEKQFSNSLQNTIIPAFQTMILDAAQKKIMESERRINEQIRTVSAQHEDAVNKIGQLSTLMQAFSETLRSMAESQTQFQTEILKGQDKPRKASESVSAISSETLQVKPVNVPEVTPEQQEIETIDEAMQNGSYEQGVIIWLQSTYQTQIFDEYFVRYDPTFLQGCSSLVALSVIAALTISLVNNIPQRLHWLAVILEFIDPKDPDIREVAPKIMDVLCQRLEGRFMELSETNALDPNLRKFPPLTRKARELSKLCGRA